MARSHGRSDVEEGRGSARQQGQDQKEEGRRLAKHGDDGEGLGCVVGNGEREGRRINRAEGSEDKALY